MKKLSNLFVTIVNIGYFPFANGTVGSFFSYIILIVLFKYTNYKFFILLFFIFLVLSLYFIKIYTQNSDYSDPEEIVIDEFMGCYTIFILFPFIKYENEIILIISSFIIFRFFDILKPFPINLIDKKINNYIGVILDDLIAAIYTSILLILIYEYIL